MQHIQASVTGRRVAPPVEPDELTESNTVADLLRVKPQTLAAWRCAGRGPAFVKVGRRCLYRRADIAAWLGAQRRDIEAA